MRNIGDGWNDPWHQSEWNAVNLSTSAARLVHSHVSKTGSTEIAVLIYVFSQGSCGVNVFRKGSAARSPHGAEWIVDPDVSGKGSTPSSIDSRLQPMSVGEGLSDLCKFSDVVQTHYYLCLWSLVVLSFRFWRPVFRRPRAPREPPPPAQIARMLGETRTDPRRRLLVCLLCCVVSRFSPGVLGKTFGNRDFDVFQSVCHGFI